MSEQQLKQQIKDLSDAEFETAKDIYTKSFDYDYDLTAPYPRSFYNVDNETMALVSPNPDEEYKFQKSFQWKDRKFYVYTVKK